MRSCFSFGMPIPVSRMRNTVGVSVEAAISMTRSRVSSLSKGDRLITRLTVFFETFDLLEIVLDPPSKFLQGATRFGETNRSLR